MSIRDMEMNYTTTERGNYGLNKSLPAGNFKNNEVPQTSRNAVCRRLIQTKRIDPVLGQEARRRAYLASIEIRDTQRFAPGRREKIFSGLQTGEKLPSFTAIGLRGDLRGKELDPVAKDGDHLHVLILDRIQEGLDDSSLLLPPTLISIEQAPRNRITMSFIIVNDDAVDINDVSRFIS